ncbi:complex I subunit 5 family protein [Streptomyces sp. NPDC015144]|uniref:complex I subunit 5 family protein n=1 Tax=Streptomyces sp. NPDC015144 TaxID=3364944 RepID=UPI003700FC94
MSRLLPLLVAVPLFGAALLVAAGRRLPRLPAEAFAGVLAAATAALALTMLVRPSPVHEEWVGGWEPARGPAVGIVLVGDGVALGLVTLISLLTTAVVIYSWRYFDERTLRHTGAFPALILLFQAGMCGFVLAGDLFNAFVFFELMGVVAYALTGHRVEEPKVVQGALTFGVVNSLGAYATLVGIALLYARTGELSMQAIGQRLDEREGPDALVLAAFALVLTGLLVKAAAFPFHFWLPDAHAVAPTPVCMLLSGVMVELGVYGVARVYGTVFGGPGGIPPADAGRALVVLGAVTGLVGAVMSWQQRHVKRLLAYATVAHTGLFLVGLGLTSPKATEGVALYVVGHAGAKAALFACAGILLDRYGSIDEHDLFAKARELPLVSALFAMGGLALAGMPPFGTGLGKAAVEEEGGALLTVLCVAVSAATGAAVLRVTARVFWGLGRRPQGARADETTGTDEEPETQGPLGRVPVTMLAVPVALLLGALAAGLAPGFAGAVARAVADMGSGGPVEPVHWTAAGLALGGASTLLAVVTAAAALRGRATAEGHPWIAPLRRLHSGHVGDYVAWLLVGTALLGALAWPALGAG